MKLFIATDIHGSAYWAKQVVEKFTASSADCLVLLGDIYNHGPRNPFPKDYAPLIVAETLNAVHNKVIAINGNCDSEVDAMISRFPFVRDCIIPLVNRRAYLTHGHVYNKNALPNVAEGDVIVYGHFHVNECGKVGGVYYVNVSSAALPKDKSAYCILDETLAQIFDFDGNVLQTVSFDD